MGSSGIPDVLVGFPHSLFREIERIEFTFLVLLRCIGGWLDVVKALDGLGLFEEPSEGLAGKVLPELFPLPEVRCRLNAFDFVSIHSKHAQDVLLIVIHPYLNNKRDFKYLFFVLWGGGEGGERRKEKKSGSGKRKKILYLGKPDRVFGEEVLLLPSLLGVFAGGAIVVANVRARVEDYATSTCPRPHRQFDVFDTPNLEAWIVSSLFPPRARDSKGRTKQDGRIQRLVGNLILWNGSSPKNQIVKN